jgi:hypothetical protein
MAAHWKSACQGLVIYTRDPANALTPQIVETATRGAAAAWGPPGVTCSALRLTVQTVTESNAPATNDGFNRVVFRKQTWCHEPRATNEPCYDSNAVAITTVALRTRDGEIVDADIELNGVNMTWADIGAGGSRPSGSHDLQNTLTHEIGHVIGFDHPCWDRNLGRPQPRDHRGMLVPDCNSSPSMVQATTMFASTMPGDISKRDLEADDKQAVCDVYPTANSCSGGSEVEGGCSYGAGRRATLPFAAFLVAAAVLLRRLLRRS